MREPVRRWGFRLGVAALLLLAGHYLFFGGVYSVFDIRAMEDEREDAVSRLDSLISRTDSLSQRGDSLEFDPLSVERTAREEHGMIRDGEVIVRFHSVDSAGRQETTGDAARGARERPGP